MYSKVISKYLLCLRSVNFQIRHVEKAFVHPYFSPEQSSDIALLKLDEPLEFNDFVKVRFHEFQTYILPQRYLNLITKPFISPQAFRKIEMLSKVRSLGVLKQAGHNKISMLHFKSLNQFSLIQNNVKNKLMTATRYILSSIIQRLGRSFSICKTFCFNASKHVYR